MIGTKAGRALAIAFFGLSLTVAASGAEAHPKPAPIIAVSVNRVCEQPGTNGDTVLATAFALTSVNTRSKVGTYVMDEGWGLTSKGTRNGIWVHDVTGRSGPNGQWMRLTTNSGGEGHLRAVVPNYVLYDLVHVVYDGWTSPDAPPGLRCPVVD